METGEKGTKEKVCRMRFVWMTGVGCAACLRERELPKEHSGPHLLRPATSPARHAACVLCCTLRCAAPLRLLDACMHHQKDGGDRVSVPRMCALPPFLPPFIFHTFIHSLLPSFFRLLARKTCLLPACLRWSK